MANLDRGAYGDDKLHDFTADEMSEDAEKSRLPLLVLIALVVLAAFGGVVWLAYSQGVERGRADAPRIIVAQSHPAAAPKTPPSPYGGLNIYQPVAPATSDSDNADTVPPPPKPLAATHPISAASSPAAAQTTSAPPALRPSAAAKQEPPLPVPTVKKAQAAQAAQQPETMQKSSTPKTEPAPAALPPAEPAPAATTDETSAPPPIKSGGVLLQIGSYKSNSEAMQSWNAFKARHATAAGYQPNIVKVELGAKGTWYRLRLGAFADKKTAAQLCEKLKAQGARCLLAK